MRIDSVGNLGLGVTPSAWSGFTASQIKNGSVSTTGNDVFLNSNMFFNGASWRYIASAAAAQYFQDAGVHVWRNSASGTAGEAASPTERMRITSGGYVKASDNGTYISSTGSYHEFTQTQNLDTFIVRNTNASLTNAVIEANATRNTTNNSFFPIGYYNSTAGVYRFRVADSGNVTNTNNSYGSLSDIKLKENIADATPKLEKLNQIRIVNYNLIGEETKQIGVIAQELEQIFPNMVEETFDRDADGNLLETTTKSVKYSVFVPMLIKSIQELKAIVDAQAVEIAALKTQVGE
jgi:hypothetical protein